MIIVRLKSIYEDSYAFYIVVASKGNINYTVHKSDVKRLGNVLKGAHHPSN